ncbi:pancreatic secretory granule membrane major glycoprotein GP2-like, partial [Hemitrygon akajei]|uniref:pancreatic secretory granule membrane major glycoprotein GP2-like n=1 Tax=Hemitrygon akajei TaxID=2704970 RepID=UPI003BFA1E0D
MSDGNLAVGWYRFNSSGGWKIPETVVPHYRCSGYYSGWLNGLHPNVGEGEVTRTVCFTQSGYTCSGSRGIRVKNCSGYFVYWLWLTPWSNYAVYCTEPLSDTTQERQGSVTGEPGPGLTTTPAGSVSSGTDSQSDTTWEAQETTTGEPGLGLTSSPAGSLSSDLENSTLEQSTGLSTGEHTQELSSVPAGDTSS